MEDPVKSMEDNRANDPERDSFRKRINELMNAFGVDTEFTASDVFEKCSEMIPSSFGGKPSAKNQGLCDAFVTREGKSASAISIGLQLKKDQGRVIGQRSIRRVGSDKAHGLRYKMQGPIIEPEPF